MSRPAPAWGTYLRSSAHYLAVAAVGVFLLVGAIVGVAWLTWDPSQHDPDYGCSGQYVPPGGRCVTEWHSPSGQVYRVDER